MAVHPAAPNDLRGLIDAWAQCARAIADLGAVCRTEDFAKPTACPGWSVQDQFSHVADLESVLAGGPQPEPVDVSGAGHVRNAMGERMEHGVIARRDRPGRAVVDEIEVALAEREQELRAGADSGELTLESPVSFLGRDLTLEGLLRMRIVDLWMHEQDLREALMRPGNLDSPAAAVTMHQLEGVLPRQVVKEAGIEPGHVVILDVTGPLVGRMGVRVCDEDGQVRGLPLFTGEPHEGSTDESVTTLTLSTACLGRLAGGRVEPSQARVQVHGDEDVAARVLAALTFTP